MYPMLCIESNNHPLGATTTVNECQSVILCPIAENILRPIAENVLYPPRENSRRHMGSPHHYSNHMYYVST